MKKIPQRTCIGCKAKKDKKELKKLRKIHKAFLIIGKVGDNNEIKTMENKK